MPADSALMPAVSNRYSSSTTLKTALSFARDGKRPRHARKPTQPSATKAGNRTQSHLLMERKLARGGHQRARTVPNLELLMARRASA
jgi:hypothetical protein